MKAKETLETALELVTGDRAEQHGDMRDVHDTAARLWTAYHNSLRRTSEDFVGEDVAVMLALLKLARIMCGSNNPDNYIDFVGYGAIAAELSKDAPNANLVVLMKKEPPWEKGEIGLGAVLSDPKPRVEVSTPWGIV